MTEQEKIKKISELLNNLGLADISKEEFDEEILNCRINEIKEELWRLYCFVEDICDVLNE